MINSLIKDGRGGGHLAEVSHAGQLITAPLEYDISAFHELDATGTAFSFFPPRVGFQFVITGIRIKASRSVSNTVDADVILYESDAVDSTTENRILHREALIRGESVTLFPMNTLITLGKFVNAKTTDATVFISIFGYYVAETPAE